MSHFYSLLAVMTGNYTIRTHTWSIHRRAEKFEQDGVEYNSKFKDI